MYKICLLVIAAFAFSVNVLAQVQIDKSIMLSGSGSDAKISGIKEVTDAEDAVNVATMQSGRLNTATSVSGTNAISLGFTPAITAASLQAGMMLTFKAAGNNTGAVTIDVDGGGPITARAIFKNVSNNLSANDIQNNQMVTVIYDGANFQLLSRGEFSFTEVDGSTTNELQTIAGGPGSNDVTLSNGGGTITLNGGGLTSVSRSGNTYTISSTADADASTTNELQTIAGGPGSNDVTLSNGGGTITFNGGGLTSVGRVGNTYTISSVGDGNTMQTIAGGPGTNDFTLSNSGGTITLNGGGLTSVSRSGNTYTISSVGDGNSGGTVTGAGVINRVAFWNGTNSITNSGNFTWDNGSNQLDINGRIGAVGLKVASGFGDLTNNAPWYGIGLSNLTLSGQGGPAVQIGGYYGINFAESGANRMVINQGKVGIGTTNPTATLQVQGTTRQGDLTTYVKTVSTNEFTTYHPLFRQFHDHANWGYGGVLVEVFTSYYGPNVQDYGMYWCEYGYSGGGASVVTKIPGGASLWWDIAINTSGNYYYRDLYVSVPYYQIMTIRITTAEAITTSPSGVQSNVIYFHP